MCFPPVFPHSSARPRAARHAALCLAICAGTCFVTLAPIVRAAEPLSLGEALRVAVAQSSQLASQKVMVEAAREMAGPARELPDPQLIAGIDNMPVSGPEGWSFREAMTMAKIGVMQEFPLAEKRQLRAERAEREAQKGEVALEASGLAVRRETAIAWFNRYFSEAAERAVAAQIAQAELVVTTTSASYRAGKASQADLLAAQAMVIELRNRAVERAMDARRAKSALARYVGRDAERPLGETPDLSRLPYDVQRLTDTDLQPEVRAVEAQEALLTTEGRLAAAMRKPDWSAELTYGIRGSGYADMVSLMFRIGLPWSTGTRQDKEHAAKLKEVDAARAMREDTRRMRTAEVQQMLAEWEAARAQATRIREDLLPLAAQRVEAALAAYRGSMGPVAMVLDARKAELDAQLMLIGMEQTAARAWAFLSNVIPPAGQS
jgi:outer membrane protein TolC